MEKNENEKETAGQKAEPKQPPKKDFKQMFQEHEAKIDWAEKAFNIDDFQNDPEKLQSIVVPGVGKIEYKLLTTDEMREFKGIADDFEVSIRMIYWMLKKANPNITLEKIQNMDPFVSGAIMKAIIGKDRLFLTSQASNP